MKGGACRVTEFTPHQIRRGKAARTIAVFAAAVVLGILVAVKIGEGNPWIAAAAAGSVFLFVVLPVRLWWLGSRVDE